MFYAVPTKGQFFDMATLHVVHADWDAEAQVWVATSQDVPGLVTEAPTMELLNQKLEILAPELAGGPETQAKPTPLGTTLGEL